MEEHNWLTPMEAAKVLRISRGSIYRAIRSGEMRAVKANGRDFRIARQWIQDFMEREVAKPTTTTD